MEKREKRRDQTIRHGERHLRIHLRVIDPRPGESAYEKTCGWFAKRKSICCGCRRTRPGQPKLVVSLCHGARGYHPSTRERIRGARLTRAWLRAARAGTLDDAEL
jgi:hypothetical protein